MVLNSSFPGQCFRGIKRSSLSQWLTYLCVGGKVGGWGWWALSDEAKDEEMGRQDRAAGVV